MKKILIIIIVAFVVIVGFVVILGFVTGVKNNVQTKTQSIKTEQNSAKDQQIKTDISRLQSALELYRVDNGNYPSSMTDLVPKYINPLPISPYTSSAYTYTATGSTYTISASLGDGTEYSQKNP